MNYFKIALPILTICLLLFQNCSQEFQALDEVKYGSNFINNQRAIASLEQSFDQKYLAQLISSENLIFDSLKTPTTVSTTFFLQEYTFFAIIKDTSLPSVLQFTVDKDQRARLELNNSNVSLTHEAPYNNYSKINYTSPGSSAKVITGRIGTNPKDFLLMVNGEFLTIPIEVTGNPINFSYLETAMENTNVERIVLFNRPLEPGEMNSFSRFLARQYEITTQTALNTPDIWIWDSAADNQFLKVKNLLSSKCFACHASWNNLKQADYTTANAFNKNRILVTPGALSTSPLWFYLNGSSDDNQTAPRNMPLNEARLSDEQLLLIKTWIESGFSTQN